MQLIKESCAVLHQEGLVAALVEAFDKSEQDVFQIIRSRKPSIEDVF